MPPTGPEEKAEDLPAKVAQQQAQIRWLELRVKDLEIQLYGKKSEARRTSEADGNLQWDELMRDMRALAPVTEEPPSSPKAPSKKTGLKKGPKPLDPALPREVITVAAPDLKDLICPVTGRPMQPAFVEVLEVLARKPAEYFVKRYERTVFTSPAKTAPVYGPWPEDVLPRSRVHASIVAHIAAMHFCEHQPYYRLEKHLERLGVDLPRVCQVSLMAQLEERTRPLLPALQAQIFASGYIHLDATPIDMARSVPARGGAGVHVVGVPCDRRAGLVRLPVAQIADQSGQSAGKIPWSAPDRRRQRLGGHRASRWPGDASWML